MTEFFFQGQSICTEGQSLFQDEEEDENDSSESFAFTQYPRPTLYPSLDSDQPHDAKFMGYSIVTEKFRLTNWFRFNSKVSTMYILILSNIFLENFLLKEVFKPFSKPWIYFSVENVHICSFFSISQYYNISNIYFISHYTKKENIVLSYQKKMYTFGPSLHNFKIFFKSN